MTFDTNRWRTPDDFLYNAMFTYAGDRSWEWVDCACDKDNWHDFFRRSFVYPEKDAFNNGLEKYEVGWLNPPYRQKGHPIGDWVEWASEQPRIICLLPASTDTRWFHDIVLKKAAHIDFIKGRIHFEKPDENGVWRPVKQTRHANILVMFDESVKSGPTIGTVTSDGSLFSSSFSF